MITNPDDSASRLFQCNVKRAVVLLMLGIPFIYGGIEFFSRFPRTYTWSELLINYQGGFVRRGLLGEVSYQLNGLVGTRYFLTMVPILLYLITSWGIVFREKINFSVLLFLFSPATIFFPIHDLNAFARKDVFILAAFVLCIYLSDHIRSKSTALLLTMILYGIVGLIIESAWFYLPMACAVIILNKNDDNMKVQSRAWLISFFYLVSGFIFISIINTFHFSKASIVDSWRLLYPSYQWDLIGFGAISFLGLPLKDGLLLTISRVCHQTTLEGYLFSLLLASIPAVCLLLKSRLKKLYKSSILGITWAFAVMLCSFAFSTDWGRCIYLFTIHTFLFLIVISNFSEQTINEINIAPKTLDNIFLKALFLFIYATSWQVEHWVVAGQSALKPGSLLISFRKLFTLFSG